MASEKKKWFNVEIPLLRTNIKLIAYSINELNGRTVKLDLTRILRGKSMEAIVKIKVEDEKAEGNISELNLLGFFIRRMMRNNISYVEDSIPLESLDSFLRIKPFLITRKRVTRVVRKALREEAKKYLIDYFRERTSEDIFSDIAGNKLQKSLSLKLKKVYPLALCEIRMASIEKMKQGVKIDRVKKASPEEIEQEKSQIEEIEEELAKKKSSQVEEIEQEKSQVEEIEEAEETKEE